jgi:hypothetical protein
MNSRDHPGTAALELADGGSGVDRRRTVWHVVVMIAAAALAWLVFAAYRQPDLILDLAAMRLC